MPARRCVTPDVAMRRRTRRHRQRKGWRPRKATRRCTTPLCAVEQRRGRRAACGCVPGRSGPHVHATRYGGPVSTPLAAAAAAPINATRGVGSSCLMGEVRPFEVARTGPREGGGAPVYGPVLGTPATPEAVGGLGRRVWLLRTARVQRARDAPPLGRGGGSFRAAVRTATQSASTFFAPPYKMYGGVENPNF